MKIYNFYCLIKATRFQVTQNFFKVSFLKATHTNPHCYLDTIFVSYLLPSPSILSEWQQHKANTHRQTEVTNKTEERK